MFFILWCLQGWLVHIMTQGEDNVSRLAGMEVYLPTGQKLGVVYDVVIDTDGIKCTHLFVKETDHEFSIAFGVAFF
mgnify:CR=1 FL=1